MNANQHKSVAKDQMILSVHRFRRRSWIVSFLICENLRIDRSDQIIFPTLDPEPRRLCFWPRINANRPQSARYRRWFFILLCLFASICG